MPNPLGQDYTALTDAVVAGALNTILVTTLAAAKTRVFNQQVMALDAGQDVEVFRDAGDLPTRDTIINGLAFYRESVLPPPAAFSPLTARNPVPHVASRISAVGSLRREVWTYRLRFVYQFDPGGEIAGLVGNSTTRINALLDAVKAAVDAKPKFGLNSGRFDRHSGLAWPEIRTQPVPDRTVHECTGLVTVLIHAAGNPS